MRRRAPSLQAFFNGLGRYGNPFQKCVAAVQSQNQLAVIDPTSDHLVGRYALDADCETPHGFLIDAPRQLAFVSCEDSATLLVIDLRTIAIAATYSVGNGPDVLAFDPGWRRLSVASESRIVSIFNEGEQGLAPAPGAYATTTVPCMVGWISHT